MVNWKDQSFNEFDSGDGKSRKKKLALVVILIIAGLLIANSVLNNGTPGYQDCTTNPQGCGHQTWTCKALCFDRPLNPNSTVFSNSAYVIANMSIDRPPYVMLQNVFTNSGTTQVKFVVHASAGSITFGRITVVDLNDTTSSLVTYCIANSNQTCLVPLTTTGFALNTGWLYHNFNTKDVYQFTFYTTANTSIWNVRFQ